MIPTQGARNLGSRRRTEPVKWEERLIGTPAPNIATALIVSDVMLHAIGRLPSQLQKKGNSCVSQVVLDAHHTSETFPSIPAPIVRCQGKSSPPSSPNSEATVYVLALAGRRDGRLVGGLLTAFACCGAGATSDMIASPSIGSLAPGA